MNKATRINVAVLGTIFGLSGINHGFFEVLQGNVTTPGLFITAIGESHKMWLHGNEPAFTLLPNFLLTGIVSLLLGLAIVVWSLKYVSIKRGSLILFSLFSLLLLSGGGIAQILFFPWICLVATRINKPITWGQSALQKWIQVSLAKLWPWLLLVTVTLLINALIIGATGFVPTVTSPETIMSVMLACIGSVILLLPITFISGFASDVKKALN